MGGLIKLGIIAVLIAGIAYFGFYLPFGEKTLYGHMVRIFETREAKKLGSEVEKKIRHTKRNIGRGLDETISDITKKTRKTAGSLSESAGDKKQALSESLEKSLPAEHTKEDQNALKKLFRQKMGENAKDTRD